MGVTMSFARAVFGVATGACLLLAATAANADGPRGSLKDSGSSEKPFSWTGFHVGAAVGYSTGTSTLKPSDGGEELTLDIGLRGAQGVLSVGHDFQVAPGVVVGTMADYAFGDVDGQFGSSSFIIDNQLAIGGRLGYLVTPKSLWYATAGWTRAKFEVSGVPTFNRTLNGFFVGGGIEQALSQHVSLKLEYRFSDYKDFTVVGDDTTIDNDVHSVRLGVNWKFGR